MQQEDLRNKAALSCKMSQLRRLYSAETSVREKKTKICQWSEEIQKPAGELKKQALRPGLDHVRKAARAWNRYIDVNARLPSSTQPRLLQRAAQWDKLTKRVQPKTREANVLVVLQKVLTESLRKVNGGKRKVEKAEKSKKKPLWGEP